MQADRGRIFTTKATKATKKTRKRGFIRFEDTSRSREAYLLLLRTLIRATGLWVSKRLHEALVGLMLVIVSVRQLSTFFRPEGPVQRRALGIAQGIRDHPVFPP